MESQWIEGASHDKVREKSVLDRWQQQVQSSKVGQNFVYFRNKKTIVIAVQTVWLEEWKMSSEGQAEARLL